MLLLGPALPHGEALHRMIERALIASQGFETLQMSCCH
jgi:hypothetical protein